MLKAKSTLGKAALLVVLVAAVYFPVFRSGFIWNDDTFLTENPVIHETGGLLKIWAGQDTPDYFPLVSTLLWIEWRMWGDWAGGYHIVNVFLHILSALFWWRILTRLKLPGAWFASLLFAIHPVNVESVAWITEIKNVLAMLFFTLTLDAYTKWDFGRNKRHYFLSFALFILALLAKTAVVPLPLILVLYHFARKNKVTKGELGRILPFLAAAFLFGCITLWFQNTHAIGDADVRRDSGLERILIAGMAFWFYLSKVIWPCDLMFVYPRWDIRTDVWVSYVPLVMLCIIFGILFFYRRRRGLQPFICGIGYYWLMLLPIIGIFNIYFMRFSFVADHWQYFSIIGITGLAGYCIGRAILKSRQNAKIAISLVSGVCVAALCVLSFRQALLFKDEKTLWIETLKKNPGAWMAHNNLGLIYLHEKNYEEAKSAFEKALSLRPDYPQSLTNLGHLYIAINDPKKATAFYEKARSLISQRAESYVHLGNAAMELNQPSEAFAYYERALGIAPHDPDILTSLGNACNAISDFEKGYEYYRKALEINPAHALAHGNLADALLKQGQVDDAITHFLKALEIKPETFLYIGIARAMIIKKDYEKASEYFKQAVKSDPQNMIAEMSLADALTLAGHPDEAIVHYKFMMRANPNNPQVYNNAGNAYVCMGKYEEALRCFSEAVKIDPNYDKARQNVALVHKLKEGENMQKSGGQK